MKLNPVRKKQHKISADSSGRLKIMANSLINFHFAYDFSNFCGFSVAEWCAPTSCITRNAHEVDHEIGIFNHISLFCAGDVTKKFIECFRHLSLISNYLVIVFENNMIIVLLLARIDKRSNSAPKLPLISEFFFAEFCKIFLHSSSSDAHNFISHDNSLYSPHWVLQECTGPHVARASLGRPVNLCVENI